MLSYRKKIKKVTSFDLIKKIPIILFNANGYWDNLIKQLDVMEQENLLHAQHRAIITVVNSETECLSILLQLCNNTHINDYGLNSGYWESEKPL